MEWPALRKLRDVSNNDEFLSYAIWHSVQPVGVAAPPSHVLPDDRALDQQVAI